jgi:hypothetical protein
LWWSGSSGDQRVKVCGPENWPSNLQLYTNRLKRHILVGNLELLDLYW